MASLENILFALKYRDRTRDKKKLVAKQTKMRSYTVFDLILKIVSIVEGSGSLLPAEAKPYISALQNYFGFGSAEEVSLLTMFMNLFDGPPIHRRDLAKAYGVKPLVIMRYTDALEDLIKRHLIIRRVDCDGESTYRITESVVETLRRGVLPSPKDVSNLTPLEFCNELTDLIHKQETQEIDESIFRDDITHLLEVNTHLHMVKCLKRHRDDYDNLLLLIIFVIEFFNTRDDEICRSDIAPFFTYSTLRQQTFMLESGSHLLIKRGVIEHSCTDGLADPSYWKLTETFKREVFIELNLTKSVSRANLIEADSITPKKMYYNARVTEEVAQLEKIFKPRRMARIQQSLRDKGMRTGFTCIFYGGPGTGKTETAKQLARLTGRDVQLVDVPSIRDKWVGESEKNIRRIFMNYNSVMNDNPKRIPILLFNEADALFGKRTESATSSVDKAENAMQNILLQQIEDFDGILIATTNLTGALDPAFERRFLYKIKFDEPTSEERQHIWTSMIDGMSKKQAKELSERYEFTGAEIENISRKRIIDDILSGRKGLDMDSIHRFCETELLNKKKTIKIGFTAEQKQ